MKKQVILFAIVVFTLFSTNLVFARGEINLNYPSMIYSGEEFNVGIAMYNFSEDTYDVKIDFITNYSRTARIWNVNSWQSTFNYINDVVSIDSNASAVNANFRLNITSLYNQTADILIRFRDSKTNAISYTGYITNIITNTPPNTDITNPDDSDNQEEDTSDEAELSLGLDWSGDMKNGKDFEVKIIVNNLEDKNYDVKVYIYDDNKNKPISQVYGNGKWMSSTSYISEFFKGPGDKSKTVKLRIKDSSRDYNGEAIIGIRIREQGKTVYMQEMEASIDILEVDSASSTSDDIENSNDIDNSDGSVNQTEESINELFITGDVIQLGSSKIESESIKSKKNIVYESKNELIKRYSVYSFTVLLVIFLGILVFLKNKK